jgi:hypothetical protein
LLCSVRHAEMSKAFVIRDLASNTSFPTPSTNAECLIPNPDSLYPTPRTNSTAVCVSPSSSS